MENRAQQLSTENPGVQEECKYQNNIIIKDMAKELLEEDEAETMETKAGLTEVIVNIEGKNFKTLIDTGSEISVISENVLGELQRVNTVSYTHLETVPVKKVSVMTEEYQQCGEQTNEPLDIYSVLHVSRKDDDR